MSSDGPGTGVPNVSPFEAIRKEDEDGNEYWSARDLSKILGYTEWRNFTTAIEKAKKACQNSGQGISDHFVDTNKMIEAGKKARRKIDDYRLSRYACYLIVQNADPSKPIVALGQSYFAVQTRRQELADELAGIPEDQLRLLRRPQMTIYNSQLAEAAQNAGVIKSIDFAIFQDHGYMGLYGGLKAKDIHTHKGLRKSQEILDYMGSDELAANIFRASQTKQKLEREQVKGKENANRVHHQVGKKVRQTIQELGGTLPEDLPTPTESIQQLQRKEQKRLEAASRPSLFDELDNRGEPEA
ncbi:MAG TPA: DNA damage-inducible protein D [Ktedonobacteraceae bacterium]|nr:DNA damage-inducible protein D [Ktedonobacteraceae bacterium]